MPAAPWIALVLAAWLPASAVGSTAASGPPPAGASSTGAYAFVLARLLADEGEFEESLAAFGQALKLAPNDPYVHTELAQLELRLGKVAEAATQAKAAAALAPENPDVLRTLGQVHLAIGPREPAAATVAREAFEKLRRARPGDLEALVSLGQLYLTTNQPALAAERLREAARFNPRNSTVTSLLAEALTGSGQLTEAEALRRDLLAADPGNLEYRFDLVDVLDRAGRFADASALLRAAPAEQQHHPELRRRLAFELYRDGDLATALPLLDGLLADLPDHRGAHFLRALVLLADGQTAGAIGELEPLHEQAPQNVEVGAKLAEALAQVDRTDDASTLLADLAERQKKLGRQSEARQLEVLRAEVALRAKQWPEAERRAAALAKDTDAGVRRAAVLLEADALVGAGKVDVALERLAAAPDPAPEVIGRRVELLLEHGRDPEAQTLLAGLVARGDEGELAACEILQRRERYAESLPRLRELASRLPGSVPVLFRLGAALERTGEREEAVRTFRSLLEQQPDFAPALNYLGYMWIEKGENLEQATAFVRRALAHDPESGAYVDSLGWAFHQKGDHARAQDLLERAVRLLPDDATVLEHLGDSYRSTGNVARARATYERALALGGDHPEELRRKLATTGEKP